MILSFARSELVSVELARKLIHLLGVQSNQNGAIGDAIARYQKDRERLGTIESDLQALRADRERIDSRIRGLETERAGIPGFSDRSRDKPKARATPSSVYKHPESAYSPFTQRKGSVFRVARRGPKWLDEQLIDKVEGVHNNQAVSFGIMELRDDKGKVENEGEKTQAAGLERCGSLKHTKSRTFESSLEAFESPKNLGECYMTTRAEASIRRFRPHVEDK